LLLLSAVIATAGVVSDSTATVIGAMIIAPLMTPIQGVVLGVVLADRANLGRCLLLLAAGAAAVVAMSWLLGHLVPYSVTAATNSQVAGRVTPPAGGSGGRPGHRVGGLRRTRPAGYLRHSTRRGHRHLAGAAAGRGRPDAPIRGAQSVPGSAVAVRHERGCHPGQRHRGDGLYRTGRASGQATDADFHRPAAVVIIALLLLAVLVPLWINSERIDKTTIRQADVQAVAEHWVSEAGWSVIGVTATGDRVLIDATGPNPAPDLAKLRQDLDAAGLGGLDVRVSLVTVSYQPLPK
jgi:hypothetical protein